MKNKAAVSLGKIGGGRNTKKQREARSKNLVGAREKRREMLAKAKASRKGKEA